MKVVIGKYLNWWGPYQLADLLKYVGLSEDRCYQFGEWLSNTWINSVCQWIHNTRTRTTNITIHNYDVWSMDHTLSLIIHPMLVKLKAQKHGAPCVDDVDVPQHLRSSNAPAIDVTIGEVDQNHFLRWDWVLDEMIWTFDQINNQDTATDHFYKKEFDSAAYTKYCNRISNGTRLFGVYFRALWD